MNSGHLALESQWSLPATSGFCMGTGQAFPLFTPEHSSLQTFTDSSIALSSQLKHQPCPMSSSPQPSHAPFSLSFFFSSLGHLISDTPCNLFRILHMKCISGNMFALCGKTLPVGTMICPVPVTQSYRSIGIHLTLAQSDCCIFICLETYMILIFIFGDFNAHG